MDNRGHIEIHIDGNKGANRLSPDNFDIKEIVSLLTCVEKILYPNVKGNRPDISYRMEEGSVRNIFTTTKQIAVSFAATMTLVSQTGSLDGLDIDTAENIENIQSIAKKNNYTFGFKLADSEDTLLEISPYTNYSRTENLMVDAEFYFYGIITNAGGKEKSNIHILTQDYGSLIISTNKEILINENRNIIYKEYGVRVRGRQRLDTGEFDKSSLELIELIDYSAKAEKGYLEKLVAKVGDKWKGIDADAYIAELRGYGA